MIARAEQLMHRVHLGDDGTRLARNLSYGEQRQLEIGIALAGEPDLLLLDEPTSGMSPGETGRMIDLIASLPRTFSILMIEHDMKVVFSVADRITVLYYGEVLATGTPADIQANARARGLSRGGALMLDLENVNAYYGDSHILHGVSLAVNEGEVVCLLGRNGAGKTTTILTIMGYLKPRPGRILSAAAISRRSRPMRWRGSGSVSCRRSAAFSSLTVRENLTVFARGTAGGRWTLERILELFPSLRARGAISASSSPAASSKCSRSRAR
jgi:ABC-type branched-subunit amino acid transport system ATPase component